MHVIRHEYNATGFNNYYIIIIMVMKHDIQNLNVLA